MSDSCDPMDCSLLGSWVHGIFQARILEWVASSFSRGLLSEKTPMLRKTEGKKNSIFNSDLKIVLASVTKSSWAFLVAQLVNNLPTMQETQVQFLGWEDSLEKEMATHSSIFAWRITWIVTCQAPLSMEFSRQEY